jgi:hypothetical protein
MMGEPWACRELRPGIRETRSSESGVPEHLNWSIDRRCHHATSLHMARVNRTDSISPDRPQRKICLLEASLALGRHAQIAIVTTSRHLWEPSCFSASLKVNISLDLE